MCYTVISWKRGGHDCNAIRTVSKSPQSCAWGNCLGMAEKLNISRGYLFSVEAGKRNIPPSWLEKLRDKYGLTEEEVKTMRQSISDSATILEIDISGLPQSKRTLAISFSRQLPSLDDPATSKIQQILDKRKKS